MSLSTIIMYVIEYYMYDTVIQYYMYKSVATLYTSAGGEFRGQY